MPESAQTFAMISDLDGTLIDSKAVNLDAYEAAFASVTLRFDRELYTQCFGLSFVDMARVLAPGVPAGTLSAIRSAKARAYRELLPGVRVNVGLIRLLTNARAVGTPTALATTASRVNVEAVLETFDLADVFDVVLCAEDVPAGKPAPDCYLLAAEALACAPAHCVVFEDSSIGVEAAERAGCQVVRVVL